MARVTKEQHYLDIARTLTKRSTCLRRMYGVVIVNNDEIISTGYNGAPRCEANCCDTGVCERERLNVPKGERYELCVAVHAEQNAIISAERDRMIGGTIYIVGVNTVDGTYASGKPCLICIRMILNAGIKNVVYIDSNGDVVSTDPRDIISEYNKQFGIGY